MAKTLTLKEVAKAIEVAEYNYILRLEGQNDVVAFDRIGKTSYLVFREKTKWSLHKSEREVATISDVNLYHADLAKVFMSVIKML